MSGTRVSLAVSTSGAGTSPNATVRRGRSGRNREERSPRPPAERRTIFVKEITWPVGDGRDRLPRIMQVLTYGGRPVVAGQRG
ncbi:hypothetical protein GCM10009678_23610 [Actinomadura kijaniata]